MEFLKGSGGETSTVIPPILLPPEYRFTAGLGQQLPSLYGRNLPSYQGQWQAPLTPTLQAMIHQAQARSVAQAPQQLGQASSVLGQYATPGGMPSVLGPAGTNAAMQSLMRFMNPQFTGARTGLREPYNNLFDPRLSSPRVPTLIPRSMPFGAPPTQLRNNMGTMGAPISRGPGQPRPIDGGATLAKPSGGLQSGPGPFGGAGSGMGGLMQLLSLIDAGGRQRSIAPRTGAPPQTGGPSYGPTAFGPSPRVPSSGQGPAGLTPWNAPAGFTPDLSADPYAAAFSGGGVYNQAAARDAAMRRYGPSYTAASNPNPLSHGAERASRDRLNYDIGRGSLPPGVADILSQMGLGQGALSPLNYSDLQHFQRGAGSTYLNDIDNLYRQAGVFAQY